MLLFFEKKSVDDINKDQWNQFNHVVHQYYLQDFFLCVRLTLYARLVGLQ